MGVEKDQDPDVDDGEEVEDCEIRSWSTKRCNITQQAVLFLLLTYELKSLVLSVVRHRMDCA